MDANIVWHVARVTRELRERQNGHKSFVLWFTGLSGAGKSTLAHSVEDILHTRGHRTYVLDGDNVRHGLNSDLGFSIRDRTENIRRIAEVSRLFMDAGVVTLTAFISPLAHDRELARSIVGSENFVEVYCHAPLEICESRDVKGLYTKARKGLISEFTGISSPYEPPPNPELVVSTGTDGLEECGRKVIAYLEGRGLIAKGV